MAETTRMKISQEGLDLIKSFEGLRLKAYLPTPDDVWTIGYGHTKNVGEGDACTEEQADQWLAEDVAWAEKAVSDSVTVPLTDNEFSACVSLCFNIGETAWRKSTLLRLINSGDLDAAALQFLRWNKQAGKELAGLTRRRAAEKEMFA